MTIRHLGVTLDCSDPGQLARFWAPALHFEDLEQDGNYVLLRAREARSGVRGLTLQRVPEPKAVKNRMHFDVVVDDVASEVERLAALGATILSRETEPTIEEAVVMADPEGNEFCVIKVRPGG